MIATALALSGALFQAQPAAKAAGSACPWAIVTTTGERVGSLDLPKRDGKPVKFRVCGGGTLTVLPSADVDWVETGKANAPGQASKPASGPLPEPARRSLSSVAKQTSLRDVDALVKQNETFFGKMKLGGREVTLDDKAPFFGKESVARHLRLSAFLADATGCPATRARVYGSVKNISNLKLRGLKALVVIGSLQSGEHNGQVQSMDPSDLVPGEESEIFLWLSCDWTEKAAPSSRMRGERVVAILADVAGRTEEVARPDGTNPFETPAPSRTIAPARTPTAASPLGNVPVKPR